MYVLVQKIYKNKTLINKKNQLSQTKFGAQLKMCLSVKHLPSMCRQGHESDLQHCQKEKNPALKTT